MKSRVILPNDPYHETARLPSGFGTLPVQAPRSSRRIPTGRGRIVTVKHSDSVADPACAVSFRLGEFAKVSLRTRDAATADVRRLAVIASLSKLYSAVRTGPVPLTQRQVTALAGECYRHLIAEHGDNPGTPREWESWKAFCRASLEVQIDGVPAIELSGRTDEQGAAFIIFGAHEGDAHHRWRQRAS